MNLRLHTGCDARERRGGKFRQRCSSAFPRLQEIAKAQGAHECNIFSAVSLYKRFTLLLFAGAEINFL